jgi:hypothetical protein
MAHLALPMSSSVVMGLPKNEATPDWITRSGESLMIAPFILR